MYICHHVELEDITEFQENLEHMPTVALKHTVDNLYMQQNTSCSNSLLSIPKSCSIVGDVTINTTTYANLQLENADFPKSA